MKLFQRHFGFSALLLGFVLVISSCGKDDEPPVITLNGDATVDVSLNGTYTDAGATATDNEDGTISVSSDFSATNPDVDKAGSYTITYSATDSEGNTATATRTVIVANDADYLAGNYGCSPSPSGTPWVQTITTSTTENNVIYFSKFANYSGNNGISAKISTGGGDSFVALSPNTQPANGIGSSGCNYVFAGNGNGMKIQQVSGKWTFSVKYTDERLAGTGPCTALPPDPFEDAFLQQ